MVHYIVYAPTTQTIIKPASIQERFSPNFSDNGLHRNIKRPSQLVGRSLVKEIVQVI